MIKAILRLLKKFKTCKDISIDFAVPKEIRINEHPQFNNYGYHKFTCNNCNFVQYSRNNCIVQELYINGKWVMSDEAVELTPDQNKSCVRGMI